MQIAKMHVRPRKAKLEKVLFRIQSRCALEVLQGELIAPGLLMILAKRVLVIRILPENSLGASTPK